MTLRRRQALCTALLLLDEEEEIARNNRAPRSNWVKPWLERHDELGVYNNLFQELYETNSLKEYIRMDRMYFDYLVERLYPYLLKEDTVMRESIKPAEQVCVFLRYVASGETFRSLEYQFRISRRSIARIVDRVAEAIIEEMQEEYLKTPKTASKWLEISEKFSQRWNFPNTIGAIDGKHIVLEQPSNSGSHYRNYKGSDSIILLAVVGPEYEFLYAEVGMNGRNSDGGAWAQSPLKMALENNTLNVPKSTPLLDGIDIPYVLVGDDAFPLSHYMMKPYPQKNLCSEKRIFNYRLSRARRISENAFGILANRWRVFRKPFLLKPKKVKSITYACLILHNFLRSESTSGKVYIPPNLIDFEDANGNIIYGAWRNEIPKDSWLDLEPSINRNPTRQAKDIRDEFKRFFVNEGTVPWQWRAAQVEH